ncbi:MAG: hypothetical protein IJ247_02135 [Bacilli bacterium]|nr:hypothetical protein [Bacilli bacterium]
MTNTNNAAVIEITASSVKFAFGYSDGKKPILLQYVKKDFSDPDIPGTTPNEKIKSILSMLRQFTLEKQNVELDVATVNVVMPSKGFICYQREMTTNVRSQDKVVDNYDIEMLTNMIANEQIPENNAIVNIIPSLYYTSDNTTYTEPPIGINSANLTMKALIHTIPKREMDFNTSMIESSGYRIVSKDVSCYCAAKMLACDHKEYSSYFYIDMGATNTTVTLVHNFRPFISLTFQIGGVNLTNDIALAFGIKMIDAEKIKKTYGYNDRITVFETPLVSYMDKSGQKIDFYQRQLNQVIENYFKNLCTQIKNSIDVMVGRATESNPSAASSFAILPIVFGGSASKMNGIKTMLSDVTAGRDSLFYVPSVVGASDPGATNVLGMILAQADKVGTLQDNNTGFSSLSRDRK